MTLVRLLGSDAQLDLADCQPVDIAGARLHRSPDGRLIATAFRSHAVDLGRREPPAEDDGEFSELILDWVEQVRSHDWEPFRGSELDDDLDWVDLRTAMVRVGWGPQAAYAAWDTCRRHPYSRELPTAAGWAAAGWVVPAAAEDPDPAFAKPVLEARGLLRWTYITRWERRLELPTGVLPTTPEPAPLEDAPRGAGWAEVLSRLRQDHYTQGTAEDALELAIDVLLRASIAPRNPIEAEDDPLPDHVLDAACAHASPLVRQAAWFVLRLEAEAWLACGYGECQHHWAVEAEEDAYEMEEVLELAGHGVANPVDAAYQRRRLLTMAFGDINDVPLAGAGDLSDFLTFYTEWVAHGRPEEDFADAARELRGED